MSKVSRKRRAEAAEQYRQEMVEAGLMRDAYPKPEGNSVFDVRE